MRIAWITLVGALAAAAGGGAQQFSAPKSAGAGGTRLGLFGFGVRGGLDFKGDGQLPAGLPREGEQRGQRKAKRRHDIRPGPPRFHLPVPPRSPTFSRWT